MYHRKLVLRRQSKEVHTKPDKYKRVDEYRNTDGNRTRDEHRDVENSLDETEIEEYFKYK